MKSLIFLIFVTTLSVAASIDTNAEFIESNGDLSISCNIIGWPDIVGKNLKIQINSIDIPPAINPENMAFYSDRLNKFITKKISKDSTITLSHISRCENEFALLADVKVDGLSLARILIQEGFAVKRVIKEEKPTPQANKEPAPQIEQKPVEQSPPIKNVETSKQEQQNSYLASKNSKIFHCSKCRFATKISPENLIVFDSYEDAIKSGRKPCETCNPSQ